MIAGAQFTAPIQYNHGDQNEQKNNPIYKITA